MPGRVLDEPVMRLRTGLLKSRYRCGSASCLPIAQISIAARLDSNGRRGETGVQVPERRLPRAHREGPFQPVNRGVTSFFVQRWNESRYVFGFVPVPDWKVTVTTRR